MRTVGDGCLEVCVMGCSQGCAYLIVISTMLTGSLVAIVAYFAG